MAEEEIIILESSEDEESSLKKEDKKEKPKQAPKNRKKLIILGGSIFALLVSIIVITAISLSGTEEPTVSNIDTDTIVDKLSGKNNLGQFSVSHLENMIKKANLLYQDGNKEEALKIYKQISIFNKAISFYNIGVAKMKEKEFQKAIDSFKKAIDNGELQCASAINAAISALELGKYDLFKYYIDLAFTYLPMESNAPLYSYYTGLINYYKDYYYESLSAFKYRDSKHYKYEQNYLASKVLASMNLNSEAINILEKKSKVDDSLTLALLYARLGEFKASKKYLVEASTNTHNPLHVKAALILVHNKLGEFKSSASLMSELYGQYDENATKIYPIRATLKNSLFDVNIAQDEFDKNLFFNDEKTYSLLFYFAPFKVFDAKQTVAYIRRGGISIFLDEIGSALSYLKKSSTISEVNLAISSGIKKALSHHTEQANQIFLKMIETYPKHSTLHYNLALTYAQMSNFSKAHKHFRRSYNLDNNNYLSGAFAVMTGGLLKKDIEKLKESVKLSISSDIELEKSNLFMSLIHLTQNNQLALTRWLEQEKDETPLNLIFDVIIAQKTFNEKAYRQNATMLKSTLPRDIMANIINFNVKHKKNDIKKYAKAIQVDFKKLDLDYSSFYYGPRLVQESFVKLLQIGGLLHHKRNRLIEKMELEKVDTAAIMQTLAYISIYTHNFEESFVLYNKLIDDFNKNDSATIFFAAIASIGANHSENAVALLKLATLINPKHYEARYALGLLYQQTENWEGAAIQYNNIESNDFNSNYFSFEVTPLKRDNYLKLQYMHLQ
jgi:tetratricopeptide (TPR) repeat protein